MVAALLMAGATSYAKDIHTLVLNTTNPQMHCANCENKIKKNIRFEKGVKNIATNLEKQTVTITYDAEKGSKDQLVAAMKKIGFEVKVLSDKQQQKSKK